MKNYIVLAPPLPAKDGAPEALRLEFVREGFSWAALLITLPWMLYRRLFVEAALYILVVAVLAAFSREIGPAATAFGLVLPLALGFLGNDIRRFALGRRGYQFRGTVSGATRDEAEIRYFFDLPEESAPPAPAKVAAAAPGAVIGLFPQAEVPR